MATQTLSNKEKRMAKAARKRWVENKDLQTVAKEIGVAYKTVRNYFTSDEMQRFERYYSEQEKQLLEAALQNQIKDSKDIAEDQLSKVLDSKTGEAPSNKIRLKAIREAQEIPKRHIKMLQELGVIQKPKERKEVTNTDKGSEQVLERMQQAYKELEQEDIGEDNG